ncbi:MAG: Dihydropteroate synthase [Acidobacteriaceae bacterium]|nr:Dihydropteroate synthase [Acidobacteriaceae bacterium]
MPFSPRASFDWKLRTRTLALGPRTLIMAILNVTPDSFSDGGLHNAPGAAVTHALKLLDEGADLLDLGGESTRPNAAPVSPDEEQARVLPVLEAILKARPGTVVSIDTFHAATARAAVLAGAEIVNDVSGFLWDREMAAACAELRCGTILMHARGTPQTWKALPPLGSDEVLPLVENGLAESIAIAAAAGLARNQIVLDPGFGFGKLGNENYTLLARLDGLRSLAMPILAGISRKGFLTKTLAALGAEYAQLAPRTSQLPSGTLAANTAAILAGAHIVRVHDVRPAREAAAIVDAILGAL